MIPVVLRTGRLVLDQPGEPDVPLITEYCQDPLFERYTATPWPYDEHHARSFVTDTVPRDRATGSAATWAIRSTADWPILGMIGYRAKLSDLGFWLGSPHRGTGYMTEAVGAVLDWAFGRGVERVAWECVRGNLASASVARRSGFRFTGEAAANVPARDGTRPPAWHGEIRSGQDRSEKPGWPA
jgi:RimJ/RimL family protein N-acetyltransferase